MTTNRAETLSDLSRACFAAIGPSRIAAATLVLLTDPDLQDTATRDRFDTARNRIKIADQMLRHTFDEGLANLDHPKSVQLARAQSEAADALLPFMEAPGGSLDDLCNAFGGRKGMNSHYFDVVDPRVSEFLEIMITELIDAELHAQNKRDATALQDIRKANTIGRAISLIAVNAAIEASRSGHKGFKVIADEIKGLASETQKVLDGIIRSMPRS